VIKVTEIKRRTIYNPNVDREEEDSQEERR
jgi:hypothetical protein